MIMIALGFFYISIVIVDVLQIWSYGGCISYYRTVSVELEREAYASVVLHLVRPVFSFLIVRFAYTFPSDQVYFYRNWMVRYGIVFILGAVTWVWLDSELHHVYEFYEHPEDEPEDWTNTGIDCHDVAEHGTFGDQCACKHTHAFRELREIGRYLYPVNVEFALLALENFFHYFFSVRWLLMM